MKSPIPLFAAAFLAAALPSSHAQDGASTAPIGAERKVVSFTNIQIKNFDGESLGRITDLGIDLVNGRIVEVLVQTDDSLGLGSKIVAVPPLALLPDALHEVYLLNASIEVFKSAAAIDLNEWLDAGRSERVAAAYILFGQEPYFLEAGDLASKTDARPKVSLGYVERSSKILDLPVGNFQGQKFGKVWSLTLDIPRGRILSIIVLAPGNFLTKSIIPATALSFNTNRDALLLDDTKVEYAAEPRYVLTEPAFGQDASSEEQAYKGPRTSAPLEQGTSYRDVDRTVLITRGIRTAKLNGLQVQVGTIHGRVTLRGWVNTEEQRVRIGEIAIAASRLEVVDNQITVGRPPGRK